MDKLTRILVVDDHEMVLDGIKMFLKGEPEYEIIGTANSVDEAVKMMQIHEVDILITDLSMPGKDGIHLCEVVKKEFPNVQVLVLSMHMDFNSIDKTIKNNVKGYISKSSGSNELLTALESLRRGEAYFSQEIKNAFIENRVAPAKATNLTHAISSREKEVLTLIAQELINKEIADRLFISENTVMVHRKNLIRKLNVRNTAGLIKVALENGLIQ